MAKTGLLMVDDYHTFVKECDEWRRKRDEAKGGLVLLYRKLQAELGVKTLKEAKALLERLKDERRKMAGGYSTEFRKVRKGWKKRPRK